MLRCLRKIACPYAGPK
ncbi:hypothetical protein AVEN_15629-1, partial [Araneus ventricosus]